MQKKEDARQMRLSEFVVVILPNKLWMKSSHMKNSLSSQKVPYAMPLNASGTVLGKLSHHYYFKTKSYTVNYW